MDYLNGQYFLFEMLHTCCNKIYDKNKEIDKLFDAVKLGQKYMLTNGMRLRLHCTVLTYQHFKHSNKPVQKTITNLLHINIFDIFNNGIKEVAKSLSWFCFIPLCRKAPASKKPQV